ncbi:DNA-deoxyinosine glycosylase [Herminiimonas sp. KBW02]|uniref:DNA-deoxyinosine glycosylase n=1 Tax=Herminiimonas sp. KBW02 TaxID=2153363 RepID=UPI000F5A8CDF|nr:DNA-deoxyinosine glycosylase [Herminiimonas sp. KBW02]RQO33997.1 DNA-deoxyinosine glycosylase [Herminiimonas sp. KBW02]
MPATRLPPLLTGFPPVIDQHTEILILGSFPGVASLDAQQYYAHPRNQFWKLTGAVIGADLAGLPYAERLLRLQTHRIGIWDVIDVCAREGSLDSAIRQARHNDFAMLKQECPGLRRVCFNGKTSGKQESIFAAAGFDTLVLPSSSPAYALMTFEQKLTVWRGIML